MKRVGWFFLNVLQAIFLSCWSAFWITAAAIVSIFSREIPLVLARRFWGPGLIAASIVRLRVDRSPKLEPNMPYVFVMNHQSMIDIPVAFAAIPRNVRFVAKEVLRFVPFIGFYMWRTGMVFVDRKDPRSAYNKLGRAVDQLKNGDCFLAYPEGTRSVDGRIYAFKRGPFVTAVRAGVHVVPVAVEGSGRALGRGAFNVRAGTIRVAIGDPIPTADLSEDDVPELIRRVRGSMIALHRGIGGAGGEERAEYADQASRTADSRTGRDDRETPPGASIATH